MASQQVARAGLPARLRANFGASLGAAPTSAAGECAGASLAACFALHSPAALPLRRSSLGTRSESGGDADRIDRCGRGAQGTTESSADARDPMTSRTKRVIASTQCRRQLAARSWAFERSRCEHRQPPMCGGGSAHTGVRRPSPESAATGERRRESPFRCPWANE
jgi:hypothetical protein